jgi:hypothetical protein
MDKDTIYLSILKIRREIKDLARVYGTGIPH